MEEEPNKLVSNFEKILILYRNKESHAALWLIDKYARIVNEVCPIVQKKQKAFDNAMVAIIVGIMMYVVAVLLRKGGF